MTAIYKKELKHYLYSVTGSVFTAVNLFVLGLYFLAANLLGMSPVITNVVSGSVFILMMMVPVLTMRILSEEKRQKTDELLLTSPVSVPGMVVAKYLSLLTVMLIPVAVICIMTLVLSPFGKVYYAESYTAVLGYFLYGAACLSMGLFISALSESQIIAAVLTFIALFMTNVIKSLVSLLTESGNEWLKIFNFLDFPGRLDNFFSGILDLKAAVYYLSVILLFLFLTVQAIEKRRYTVSKATLSLSAYSLGSVVVVTAAAVLLNFFVDKIPSSYAEYDTTEEKIYTLTDDSKEFLNKLDKDITIYVMGKKDTVESYGLTEVIKTLEQYEENSKHIKVIYKDPSIDPSFAEKYTDDKLSIGSLIVVSGDRSKAVSSYDLYKSEIDYTTYSEKRTGYDGEGRITSAISFVTANDLPKLYVLTGHDEFKLGDFPYLKESADKMNLETEDFNLLKSEKVPEDAAAVLILSPKSDLSSEDAAALKDYMKKGGNLIATMDYSETPLKNYESLLLDYGVTHVNGLILEGDKNHVYEAPVYVIPDAGESILTAGISSRNLLNLFPQTTGFKVDSTETEDYSVDEVLVTTASSYAKTSVNDETKAAKEAGDEEGPFALAVYVKDDASSSKAAVFGTSNIFVTEINDRVGGANVDLFTNALKEMTDTELTAAIPAKSYNKEPLTVPFGRAILIGLVFILIIPLSVLILGIWLFLRRRKR